MIRGSKQMNDRRKTIDEMKKQRTVPAALRERVKRFATIRKAILGELKSEPMTIPQIAERTGLERATVTYHLMTLRKFGEVEAGDMDDMDEYYYYRVKE